MPQTFNIPAEYKPLLERCAEHLKFLHSEDAYGAHRFSIEKCGCDLSDDYLDLQGLISLSFGESQ